MREITDEKLAKYFEVTTKALEMAKAAPFKDENKAKRADILDMVQRYVDDAHHFKSQEKFVIAFAALNYAHGWLDAGARLGIYKVNDSTLFTVDEE